MQQPGASAKSRVGALKGGGKMDKTVKAAAPIGTPGVAFALDGKISADDATRLYKDPQSTAVALGKLPMQ